MIVDDRGQQVPLFQWSRGDKVSSDNAKLAEALMKIGESADDLGFGTTLTRKSWVMIIPGALAFTACVTMVAMGPTLLSWTILIVVSCVAVWVGRWVGLRLVGNLSLRMTVTMLAYGHCASCGYSLSGAVAAEGGVVGCPECGAGWKSGRIGIFASPAIGSDVSPERVKSSTEVPRPWSVVGQWNRSPSIVDAAERVVGLIDVKVLRERLKECSDADRASVVLKSVDQIVRRHRTRTVGVIVLAVSLAMLLIWSRAIGTGGVGSGTLAVWLIVLCTGLPVWIMWIRKALLGRSQTTAKPVQRAIVNGRFCPACGDDLNDGVPARDGAVACTCGTSWRLPLPHLLKRAEQEMVSSFLGGRLPKL